MTSPGAKSLHEGVHGVKGRRQLVERLALAGLLIVSITGCGSSMRAQPPTTSTATSSTLPTSASHGVVGVDSRTIGETTRECFLTDVPSGTGPVPSRGVELCDVSSSTALLYSTCSASAKPGVLGYLIERKHGGAWKNSACEQASQVLVNSH
jgi:hypothetical protein